MTSKAKLLAAVVGGALLVAAPAEAQIRTVTFGVSGGVSIPVGELGDHFGTGWHVQGSLAFAPMALPFGVRADLFYQDLPDDVDPGENETTLAGIVNAIFGFGGNGARPYGSLGAGVYNIRLADDLGEVTKLGLNLGLGVQFGLGAVNAFLEGKFHHVFADESTQFIPLSIGILF